MSRHILPPGPRGGYKKGGRPVKPRLAEPGTRKVIERPWLKEIAFPKMIRVDWSKIDPKKTNVIYAGRAARLRNRLRNHPLHEQLNAATNHDYEIWVWKNPERSIQDTLKSRKPDLRLSVTDFKNAPDEPAVYVWVAKPKKVNK